MKEYEKETLSLCGVGKIRLKSDKNFHMQNLYIYKYMYMYSDQFISSNESRMRKIRGKRGIKNTM